MAPQATRLTTLEFFSYVKNLVYLFENNNLGLLKVRNNGRCDYDSPQLASGHIGQRWNGVCIFVSPAELETLIYTEVGGCQKKKW